MLIDVSHTAHTRARTGIQRVVRSLAREWSSATPITYDPFSRAWRGLQSWEQANLSDDAPGSPRRGAAWPFTARCRGLLSRWLARRRTPAVRRLDLASPLLVPELFPADRGRALAILVSQLRGPKVAIFHDAIALKLPELSPKATVARFPVYLQELLQFDAIAAVSNDSRDSLLAYWDWLGVDRHPRVEAIPLGGVASSPLPLPQTQPFSLLSVGTIEGRKNHLSLLQACAALWDEGLAFTLTLVGHAHAVTGRAAQQEIERLQKQGRPLVYRGPLRDVGLENEYAKAHATVYPSLMEGFGLPVLESLARGRPCICSRQGAIGESAQGGGCLTVDAPTVEALRAAIRELVSTPQTLETLREEALGRSYRTWADYRADLQALFTSLEARR